MLANRRWMMHNLLPRHVRVRTAATDHTRHNNRLKPSWAIISISMVGVVSQRIRASGSCSDTDSGRDSKREHSTHGNLTRAGDANGALTLTSYALVSKNFAPNIKVWVQSTQMKVFVYNAPPPSQQPSRNNTATREQLSGATRLMHPKRRGILATHPCSYLSFPE